MNSNLKAFICSVAYSPIGSQFMSSLGVLDLWAKSTVRSRKEKMLAEAKQQFENGASIGTLDDYKQALERHWVSYNEYAYQYEFPEKSESERDEYVSRLRMAYFYWRNAPSAAKSVFRNKTKFLASFKKYVHRKWLYVPDASFEEFEQMVTQYDCIVKPCDGKLGRGIFKVYKDDDHRDDRKLYDDCVKNRALLEQCIESCDELKALHPQSLNTIRIVTVSNKEKACVFSGVLRTGVGDSVVDNSHAGGVSAQINVKNGIVESDGSDTHNNRYVSHPDSDIQFKGFQVPRWNQLVDACCEAAKQTGNPITGWDVVIDCQGEVEFVEANYGPDLDMMQSRYKQGVKKRIYALIKEYCGIEMN